MGRIRVGPGDRRAGLIQSGPAELVRPRLFAGRGGNEVHQWPLTCRAFPDSAVAFPPSGGLRPVANTRQSGRPGRPPRGPMVIIPPPGRHQRPCLASVQTRQHPTGLKRERHRPAALELPARTSLGPSCFALRPNASSAAGHAPGGSSPSGPLPSSARLPPPRTAPPRRRRRCSRRPVTDANFYDNTPGSALPAGSPNVYGPGMGEEGSFPQIPRLMRARPRETARAVQVRGPNGPACSVTLVPRDDTSCRDSTRLAGAAKKKKKKNTAS